jgi:putative ABC transport system ATP-binding protein
LPETQVQPVSVTENGSTPVAELHRVRKAYFKPDGSIMVEALCGVDVTIRRGEYVAIMGASGSGKSTMMNILGCLDQPTEGEYLLDGRDVSVMSDEELSAFRGKRVGFVFQAFNLIPQLKIEDNIAVPLFYQHVSKHDRLTRALEVLKMVGLDDRVGHRPAELSGGQQQRAAIARALAINPVILMADEPTGNLDSKTGEAILDLFDELHRGGMTIIMVTHDDGVSGRCERIIRLRDGLVESDEKMPSRRA